MVSDKVVATKRTRKSVADIAEPEVTREQSAYWACVEMDAGRLDWLRFHIIQENFKIDELVARKLLELVVGAHPDLQLVLIKNPKLNPKSKHHFVVDVRDLELAEEVARRGGFERGMLPRVCHEVGDEQDPKLMGSTVAKLARRYKKMALKALEAPIRPQLQYETVPSEIPQ